MTPVSRYAVRLYIGDMYHLTLHLCFMGPYVTPFISVYVLGVIESRVGIVEVIMYTVS